MRSIHLHRNKSLTHRTTSWWPCTKAQIQSVISTTLSCINADIYHPVQVLETKFYEFKGYHHETRC